VPFTSDVLENTENTQIKNAQNTYTN